jgi:hypothetical protein
LCSAVVMSAAFLNSMQSSRYTELGAAPDIFDQLDISSEGSSEVMMCVCLKLFGVGIRGDRDVVVLFCARGSVVCVSRAIT